MSDIEDKKEHRYTVGEEIANGIIHGIATLLSIAGLVVLIVLAAVHGSAWHVVGFSVFGSTLIILFSASTLYHSLSYTPARKVFRIIDHSAILLLIAGTYTPFLLVSLRGALGWSLFGVIWGIAVTGIVFKCIFGSRARGFYILLYIILGWLCILAIKKILIYIPAPALVLLAVGGLIYTIGVVFYAWRKLPFGHFIWHIFVLCGSVCHYLSLLFCL